MSQVRQGRRPRVMIHGLAYFCEKLSRILKDPSWDICYHPQTLACVPAIASDLLRCDLAFAWGGRISMGKFLWAARCLGKEKVVILWCGSDVLYALQDLAAGKQDSWVAKQIHWAVSPALAAEVRGMGLSCEYVQTSFVEPIEVPVPLPRKFSVLVYVPSRNKASMYGLDQILEVADSLRSVEFTLVGWNEDRPPQAPPNVVVHGHVKDLKAFYEKAAVIWRPVRHDAGISFMVLEALAHGRHVLYSNPFAACIQAKDTQAARRELELLLNLHCSQMLSLNEDGMRLIIEEFTPESVRTNLFRKWAEILASPKQQIVNDFGAAEAGNERAKSGTERAEAHAFRQ